MSKEAFLDSKYQSKIKRELIKTEKDIAFTPGKSSKTNSLSKKNKKKPKLLPNSQPGVYQLDWQVENRGFLHDA